MKNLLVMAHQETVLLNSCDVAAREISCVVEKYKDAVENSPAVWAQLLKTENRSKEYKNGTFIVLVVGPVKSGKSTLVNLIANAYVSPTHFLECTVRPSIISQRQGDDDCKITVYTRNAGVSRVEQIDAIIDCIRGIETESSLNGVTKSEFPLTPENIKEKVELGLRESLSSETLITSITTPGGRLMKKNVFLVDMPGVDGEYANIEDPVYDAIAQRADLVIFVQSSNSAISKVSEKFLKILADNNKAVPVCLIHNVFDSAYWRDEEERMAAVAEQKDFAIKEIRRQGFNIEESQCFSINLGKVEDSRRPPYAELEALREHAEVFGKLENLLYERIINRRNIMRLSVCMGRTRQQLHKTIQCIEEELERRRQLLDQYQKVVDEFNKTSAIPDFHARLKPITADYSALKQVIRSEARRRVNLVDNSNNHKSDSEARDAVMAFVEACENNVNASLGKTLALEQREGELFLDFKECMGSIQNTAISCGFQPLAATFERLQLRMPPSISLLDGLDIDLLVSHKTRIDILVAQFLGHSAQDLVSYINRAADCLAGAMPGDSSNQEGYIEQEGGPVNTLLKQSNKLLQEVSRQYETLCRDYWRKNRSMILDTIIPNKDDFDMETQQMGLLKNELDNIDRKL